MHVLGAAAPVKAALVVFGAIIAFHPQLCLLSLPSFAAPKLRADTPLKWTCRLEYYILKPYIYICAPAKQYDLECLFLNSPFAHIISKQTAPRRDPDVPKAIKLYFHVYSTLVVRVYDLFLIFQKRSYHSPVK